MLISCFLKFLEDNSGIIIENPMNIKYLTGFDIDNGFLVIAKTNVAKICGDSEQFFLFVDDRFLLDVNKNLRLNKLQVVRLVDFKSQIKNIFTVLKIKNIYLETDYVTLKRYKYYLDIFSDLDIKINFNSDLVSNNLSKFRSQKFDNEIVKIKEAQRLTDEAFLYIIDYIKPGLTEKQIAIELKKKVIELGSQDFAFDYIVVSGENSAVPHGKSTDRKIRHEDIITIDFGAKIDGYCSDMTRTIFVGNVSTEKKDIYNIVLDAQNQAIDQIKIGAKAKEIDRVVRNCFLEKGYDKFFTHSLGHGVGLQIHEKPSLSPKSEDFILDKQVVTIEPGIYIPGKFGIRIEDMILINNIAIENLTKSDKKLICI